MNISYILIVLIFYLVQEILGRDRGESNSGKTANQNANQRGNRGRNKDPVKLLTKEEYLAYYENFNLTQELEKVYDDENNEDDKPAEFYKDIEKVEVKGGDKKKQQDISKQEQKNVKQGDPPSDASSDAPSDDSKKKDKNSNKQPSVSVKKSEKTWEEKINAFSPHDLLTVEISKGKYETFYEDVQEVPTTLTVAFYVHEEGAKIDFDITSPSNKKVYKGKGRNRDFYEFNVTTVGIYEFHLDNGRVSI